MGNIICTWGKEAWRRIKKFISFIKSIPQWFSRRPGCYSTGSQDESQGLKVKSQSYPSPPSNNQMTQNELQIRSSPLSDMRQTQPQRYFSPSFDKNQEPQNESQRRLGPSFDKNQEPQSEFQKRSTDTNKVPKNKRSFMNQKSQNELQRRPNFSSYSCPQKGCTRTFETIDEMNRHYSRHNGRNKRK
jgi:hypothetical protein